MVERLDLIVLGVAGINNIETAQHLFVKCQQVFLLCMYLRSSFCVAVVLYLCMYLRSSFYVAVVVISVYTDITTTATQKLDLKYIHRYNYYGNAET
jgi:hypothetical protein